MAILPPHFVGVPVSEDLARVCALAFLLNRSTPSGKSNINVFNLARIALYRPADRTYRPLSLSATTAGFSFDALGLTQLMTAIR